MRFGAQNIRPASIVLLAAFLLAAGPARAASPQTDAATSTATVKTAAADKSTLDLVNYFLKGELSEANPKLVAPFLAVNIETLPKKLRNKTAARQVEVTALLRIHDTKKKGIFVQPAENCSAKDFVKPLSLAPAFSGYVEVTEDELRYIQDKTKCTEIDLGCKFSLLIFFEKKKDRILKFHPNDPNTALVAEYRDKKGGNTHFFGMGYNCMH